MFLTPDDLRTHLREEHAELISRADETIITAALSGAIAEARGYLTAYDTETIFAATGEARDPLLLIFCKDIAVYHLINLCAAGNYYDRRQARYERAVAWLRGVQKGEIVPDLPKKNPDEGVSSGPFYFSSNPKRTTHF
ncbi:phage protein Gp36 family protein [uncultured Rikenella sp.]|uniref:phage protein Gp36 family protein n=1 Tax=uncultured Rikenella sp. TaxID=368003 RepID=UPI0025FB53BE|nr:phage protein Gp36 family protein [uncultured Rikenella sp.]